MSSSMHQTHALLVAAASDAATALDDAGGIEGIVAMVLPALLVIVIFAGVALWLLGRRLARPACAVSGLVLGGLGGLLLAEMLSGQGAFAIPLIIGAGIAGGLLAALLFRVWMALSGALLLALVVPAAMLIWQGAPDPLAEDEDQPAEARAPDAPETPDTDDPTTAPTANAVIDLFERITGIEFGDLDDPPPQQHATPEAQTDPDSLDAPLRDGATERIEAAIGHGREQARTWYAQHRDRIANWWDNLSPAAKRGLLLGAGIGALFGLTLGLAVPYTAAAVQSALTGAILMFLPIHVLLERYAPEWIGLLPQSPRTVLIWLGLITVLGVLLQWTLFHKRADR